MADKIRSPLEKDPALFINRRLSASGKTIGVAESCTAGLVSCLLTSVAGSSEYFKGGVVAYDNRVKTALLDVKPETLARYGAVSSQTAKEMAIGVKKAVNAAFGLAVTGIAGPGGACPGKPVGTVYVGVSTHEKTVAKKFLFKGDRNSIRKRAAISALKMLAKAVSKP